MKRYGAMWMLAVVLAVAMVAAARGEDLGGAVWTGSVLTDAATSMVEVRLGLRPDANWEFGATGTWYAEDPGTDWGLGLYLTRTVQPEMEIPLRQWLPIVGDWLGLPETATARTYLLGKLGFLEIDDEVDLSGALGAGAAVELAVIEWTYGFIEGGDSANPLVVSGATLWLGAALPY